MLQFLKTVLENPKHINSLVELGKIAKDQEK